MLRRARRGIASDGGAGAGAAALCRREWRRDGGRESQRLDAFNRGRRQRSLQRVRPDASSGARGRKNARRRRRPQDFPVDHRERRMKMAPVSLAGEPSINVGQARAHGLTAHEYQTIQELLGRTPTFTELGVFSVMWSEHCSYKSSRKHLRMLPMSGRNVVGGPGENAGALDIGDGWVAVFKIESHNHPSFVEPYQGAATGVGGIVRDIFTMGARPIASMNSLKFGALEHPRTRYLLGGVVSGIGGYGNCVGVPTVAGEVMFDTAYNANILVNAFCLGLARRDDLMSARARGAGNPVLYVGSATGRDGIHGASLLASAEFDAESSSKRPTVQVGDPF